jgi:hypothetical protein
MTVQLTVKQIAQLHWRLQQLQQEAELLLLLLLLLQQRKLAAGVEGLFQQHQQQQLAVVVAGGVHGLAAGGLTRKMTRIFLQAGR